MQISLVSDQIAEGECTGNYSILRTVSVENCAGGSADYTYTIAVEDTTAPEFTSVPEDYTVECSGDIVLSNDATATDNCGSVTPGVRRDIVRQCDGQLHHYSHVHGHRRSEQHIRHSVHHGPIHYAPEFTFVPADYTVECSDELLLEDATAADNCNGASIELITETVEGDATGNYTLLRTFTATDDAGNSASVTQTITVQDTTAPEFTFVPGDYTAECSDELAMDMATAVDNTDGEEMEVRAETITG